MTKRATIIAGPCVIESAELLDTVARKLLEINRKHGTDIIFKASFDKANRTSIRSFRGPGLERGLQMLADVKATYGGLLREKPMNSRYKALLTTSYAPGLGKWQIDATLQLNGGGRLPYYADTSPAAASIAGGSPSFSAYEQLNMQLTRFFRHWSIYAGGENITGFKQKNAIVAADDPWSKHFDATMIWGPVHGAVWYIGFRLNWNKI